MYSEKHRVRELNLGDFEGIYAYVSYVNLL